MLYYTVSFIYWAGEEPSPLLLMPFNDLLYPPWMVDGDDSRAVGGMNRTTRRKLAPVPLSPPQIPRVFTWDGIQAVEVRSGRLIVPATARLIQSFVNFCYCLDLQVFWNYLLIMGL
jgi:hypothetical protein